MAESRIVFGRWEMTAALINAMTVQVYLGFSRRMVEIGGSAAWIDVIYIGLLALVIFLIIAKLFSRFEGKDILDVAEHIAGGTGRVITGILFIIQVMINTALILREFAEDMKIIAFVVTPISLVMLFFIAGMVFAAYIGIEAILRFHALAVPFVFIGFVIIVIGVAPYYDLTNLLPILGNGTSSILGGGFSKIAYFSSLGALFMYFPFVKTNKNFKTIGVSAIIISSVIMLLAVLSYTLVYPYPISGDYLLPVYQLARLINYGRFFQRIESMFMIIWASSALMYLCFAFFFVLHMFRKTFKLKFHRPMILPFTVLVFCLSILPQSLMAALDLDSKYAKYFALAVSLGLTLLLLIISLFVKKGGKKAEVK